jgi:UDP-N-acetylmuramoylalanine--D-glutamate ligase
MQKNKVVILGAGESGVGAALLALAKGYSVSDVFVSDSGELKTSYRNELNENNILFEENGHTEEKILSANLIVKSPGISDKVEIVQQAIAKGIEVISEIEFAYRFTRKTIIAITGSNGKTTTTLLIHHMLVEAGYKAALAGNVGSSLARHVLEDKADILVVELSSFQLDGIIDFKAGIAVLLNITPDHLDRYDYDFEKYAQSKLSIVKNMTDADLLVYNLEDAELFNRKATLPNDLVLKTFSISKESDAYVKDGDLVFKTSTGLVTIPSEALLLPGEHNQMNMMAAITVALAYDISRDTIINALASFKNQPNRLEYIANINGVEFINDSKATNVEAVYYALGSYDQPIVWIAGGQDKGNDYVQIKQLVEEKVKAMVCLGLDNTKLVEFFSGSVDNISETTTVEGAAEMAFNYAQNSDIVLLSPACASFDLFDNYAQRGEMFKEAVLNLKDKVA